MLLTLLAGWSTSPTKSNADFFAPAIEKPSELVVPSVSIYEGFKRVTQQRGEGDALQTVALMMQGRAVTLCTIIALSAAGSVTSKSNEHETAEPVRSGATPIQFAHGQAAEN
jgi:hypothetical protein